jgi:fatty-acid desaturase
VPTERLVMTTFKQDLIGFAKRYDVIFSFGGMLIGGLFVYADKMEWWGLVILILLRETFGFMGMLAKQKADE